MAIEIDFSYLIDGSFDTVNYYRSESPMNISVMPAPTATGITGLSYTDTTALENKVYYIRFSSVKGGNEKISDEIEINTSSLISYRYLRIYITQANGETAFTAIQEIEIAVGSGSDITVPSMATEASSIYSSEFCSSEIIDNDYTGQSSGFWLSGYFQAFPQWVSVDMGSIKDFSVLRIYPQYASGALNRAPKDFIVQGSNNGSTWVDIKQFSNVTDWEVGVGKEFNLITGIYS